MFHPLTLIWVCLTTNQAVAIISSILIFLFVYLD